MALWDAFVDQSCKAENPDEIHRCIDGVFLLENASFHTPIYFHQDQADPRAYSANAVAAGSSLSAEQQALVHAEIRRLFSTHTEAAYIPRQGNHVAIATERFHDPGLLDDISLADAFWSWYEGSNTLHIEPE